MAEASTALAATKPMEGELIAAPQDFRKHVREVAGSGMLDMDPVERAEQALAGLADEFPGWIQDELAELSTARDSLAEHGLDDASRERLYRAAHNLRGQAQMMNFPLVGAVSESLCNLLEGLPSTKLTIELIDLYILAMRAMVGENAAGDSNSVARSLANQIGVVTDQLISKMSSAGEAA